MKCPNCGADLPDNAKFCANCGEKVELSEPNSQPAENLSASESNQAVDFNEQPVQSEDNNYYPPQSEMPPDYGTIQTSTVSVCNPPTKGKKNIIKIIIPSVIALVILIALAVTLLPSLFKSGPDFQSLYYEYCDSTWADVGSDGTYLSIDTNPRNVDDGGIVYYGAYTAVKDINSALGLPDSLLEDMGKTTSLMGKQSETYTDIGVTVSWSYHPNNGLEVTYKLAN